MTWNPSLFRSLRKPARRRPIRNYQLTLEQLESRLAPAVNVLTFHNDLASTGLNSQETQLSPANVKVGSFGKLFTTAVDGSVYAQPLVDTGVTILNGPNTSPGAAGVHDVVFVPTEHDSLYAIDASVTGGAVLWKRTFLDTTNPSNNPQGATAIGTVPSGDTGTADITPEIGITGTPVIDANSNTLYLVVKTKETIAGQVYYVQRIHAVNLADGTDRIAPYLIGTTTGGNTNNTPIYVYGNGDGNVTDSYNGTGKPVVQFNALHEHQRGALSLVNNTLYIEWASHGDNGPYHGWVAAWDVSNSFQLKGVFNDSPNGGLAGIWQGGGRLAFEADGSAFYFETGNGRPSHGNQTLDANGFPVDGNYYEALVKVVADPSTSSTNQNKNGWGFKAADYFIPFNQVALDNSDNDFGSGAPLLLPDAVGIPGHPHLLVAAGKEGKIYLVDRDNLGKYDPNGDHVLNAVPDGSGHNTPSVLLGGALSTAAYFNGKFYWTSGYSSSARSFVINADGSLSVTSETAVKNFGYLPGSAVVSANGTMGGIVWVMDRNANRVHAYDATALTTELWNSGQKGGGVDNVGAVVKFATPTVANGELYVGTSNSLVVYGLTPPANAVPNTPALSAAALSGSSINLSWTDTTPPPNTATSYAIEQSTDNVTFTPATTAPAGATSLGIGGLKPLTTYYFRIRGFNGLGNSAYSNTASATTNNQVAVLDFGGGFAASTGKLTYNGSAAIIGTRAEVTNTGPDEAGSVFSTSAVDVSKFNTQFTFQLSAGSGAADGFTFTIQGNGPTALGPSGGGLGYGAKYAGGSGGIPNSMAVKFDLFDNEGEGPDSTGLYTGGTAPTKAGAIDLTPSGLDLHSGDTFLVNMTYDGTTLMVTVTDTVTNKTATQNYTINIPATVGSSQAYVGFTGGTGGLTAIQDILTWTFSPNATQAPNAPSALGGAPATATAVSLSWTNNAVNQSGFHLDRATDVNFSQNLLTQNLPATPNTFTDTAAGLAPGATFYYRLRAFNTAGDSVNSNVVAVAIPLAPARASNPQVTNVTTGEIDLSWTDNAGRTATGYTILRRIGNGSFVNYASLPSKNATPPTTYTWNDTNVSPGTTYEYHIEAVNSSGNNDFVGANATTITLPPGSVGATPGNGVVNLSWAAPAGALSYNVYRGTSAGGETPLVQGATATSYADTTAANGTTYFYTVTAVNANVNHVPILPSESASSSEVSAQPSSSITGPPAPTNLAASVPPPANQGNAQVNLTWTASAGATSYNVYRSLTANGEGGSPLANGLAGTSYTDTSAVFGTTYFYKVTAVKAGLESVKSNEASATPLLAVHIHFVSDPVEVPAGYLADIGLVYGSRTNGLSYGWNQDVTAAARDRDSARSPDELHDGLIHMQLSSNPDPAWSIAVPNGTYTVHVLAGDPDFSNSVYAINVQGVLAVSGTPSSTNSWINGTVTVTVTNGVLQVSNAAGAQNNKIAAIDVTQVLPGQPPNAPSALGGAPATATAVSLSWTNNAVNQSGFHLDRATDVNFTQGLLTQNLPATPNTFTDTAAGLAPGSTFYYRLRAFNTAGDSANSNTVAVPIPLVPAKPSNPQVIKVTTGEIDLSWTDNAGQTATSYVVLRRIGNGSFVNYASLPSKNATPPSTCTWNDTNVSPGTTYDYHIEAVNSSGASDFADANATTLTLPPGNLGATPGNGVVNLTWAAPAGALSYNVYRGTSAGGETPLVQGVTATSYADSTAANGTTYFYTVTAVNANINHVPVLPSESASSNEVSAQPSSSITGPPAPTNLAASVPAANQGNPRVSLTWTASAGATSYNVYRSLTANGEGGSPLANGVAGTSYTDTSAVFGTTYFYKVTAVKTGLESIKSNEASATPLLAAHIHFVSDAAEVPAGYLADTGLVYGSRANGLSYGWNQDVTAAARDRDSARSPDELHDGLIHMQRPGNPNASWSIAVPNGTYTVHVLAGDPDFTDSVYAINVQGTLAVSGTPSSTKSWIEGTVTVTVTNGVLQVSNAAGAQNNKIDAIDITQVLPAQGQVVKHA